MNELSSVPVSRDHPLVGYTHLMYALHALSAAIGLLGSPFIALAFLFSLPSIVAIVMNYLRRGAASGSWLESHFTWQRRTFWMALIAVVLITIISAPFVLIVIGIGMAWLGYVIVGIWILYRVIRGWLALRDGRPMPA